MAIFRIIGLTLVCLAVAVLGLEPPTTGYGVEEISWEVEYEQGKFTSLNGTVQEVYAQLLELNPKYEEQFGTIEERAMSFNSPVPLVAKRDSTICNVFNYAQCSSIGGGISYLKGLSGGATNGPGPGNCGRVSCSYNSAIWWCNDVCDALYPIIMSIFMFTTLIFTEYVCLYRRVMDTDSGSRPRHSQRFELFLCRR